MIVSTHLPRRARPDHAQAAGRSTLVLDSSFEVGINSDQKGTTTAHSETLGCNFSALDPLLSATPTPTSTGAQPSQTDTISFLPGAHI